LRDILRRRLKRIAFSPVSDSVILPGMRFEELEAEWDDDNIEHIGQHDVEPEEMEEIVYEDCYRRGSSAAGGV